MIILLGDLNARVGKKHDLWVEPSETNEEEKSMPAGLSN